MKINTKFYLLTILLIAFLAVSVEAQSVPDRGYSWLISQGDNGSYGNVYETAWATLALREVGRDTQREINFLMQNKNPNQFCWPRSNCNVRDTALVLKVLMEHGINIEEGLTWLENSRISTDLGGKWYLQVKTGDSGTCEIIYSKNTDLRKTVKLVDGTFPECKDNTWLNLETCFDSSLVSGFANPKFLVDCGGLNSAVISLIFNSGSDYYLVHNAQSRQADINLRNDCFGTSFGSSTCNYEASLYASWVLGESRNRDLPFFLEKEYNDANNFHNAFLTLIEGKDPYLTELITRQGLDGSWNFNVFTTSLAALALKETSNQEGVSKARAWLQGKQLADGSWNDKIVDTSLALFSGFAEFGIQQQCFAGETTFCQKQAGVCEGALQQCTNGAYLGCQDSDYSSHNSDYESDELTCDGLDNDCDGAIDEGCECTVGDQRDCSNQLGVCAGSTQTCTTGTWGQCDFDAVVNYENNETSCLDGFDNDCDGLTDLQDTEHCSPTDIVDNPPCDEGFVLCGDGLCRLDCGNDAALCNSNNICDSGESCNCADCDGLQDSCSLGLSCDLLSGVCLSDGSGCGIGEVLCGDGICRTDCGNTTAVCNDDGICGTGESCGCDDCELERDSCDFGLVCNPFNQLCDSPSEVCGPGLILCEDGVCRESCFLVCNLDNVCDVNAGEDFENCAEDCSCGDGICDDREDYLGSCQIDCGTPDEQTCGDGICQNFEIQQGICDLDCEGDEDDTDVLCNNGNIDSATFEEGIDCGGLCSASCPDSSCVENGQCELSFYEDSNNCAADCTCGDGICDGFENSQGTCEQDCGLGAGGLFEPVCGDGICEGNEVDTCSLDCEDSALEEELSEDEGGAGGLILLIIIILILLGVGVFVYTKFYKKPSKKLKFDLFSGKKSGRDGGRKPEYLAFGEEKKKTKKALTHIPQKESSRSSAIEKELEKSIEEAKKLIKGK